METMNRFHFAILQPNSTANVPSQLAILSCLAFHCNQPIAFAFGSIECRSLIARLVDKNQFKVLLFPRIPFAFRGGFSFALNLLIKCFNLLVANVIVNRISPSLFPANSRLILSGDAFGFSNLPEWNSRLSARTVIASNESSLLDLSPYSITPSYKCWVTANQPVAPSFSIDHPVIHSKIQNLIQDSLLFVSDSFGINDIFSYSSRKVCLLALSAFSENQRITMHNEVELVVERLLEVVTPGTVVFLKPHPFDSPRKINLILGRLRNIYPTVLAVPDIAPVEFLLQFAFIHFKDFLFVSFQQSAISAIILDHTSGLSSLRFGFGSNLLRKYWNGCDLESRLLYEQWVNALIISCSRSPEFEKVVTPPQPTS